MGPAAKYFLSGRISIGDGVALGQDVLIISSTHNYDSPGLNALPYDEKNILAPVKIENNCWITARALILPGVTVSEGSIVGAGSIVVNDVPAFAIVVGNPAKIVNYRNKQRYYEVLGST